MLIEDIIKVRTHLVVKTKSAKLLRLSSTLQFQAAKYILWETVEGLMLPAFEKKEGFLPPFLSIAAQPQLPYLLYRTLYQQLRDSGHHKAWIWKFSCRYIIWWNSPFIWEKSNESFQSYDFINFNLCRF